MIIMELLGPNLEVMFESCNRKFSLKTTLLLVDQILDRISKVHAKGYLHRNLTPENLLRGVNDCKNVVYLIDFARAKRFIKHNEIIPFSKGKRMTWSICFASVNSQLGFEQSRRDDLESIGYIMVYFLKGELPWQKTFSEDTDERAKLVLRKKLETPVNLLCKGLPEEFKDYLNYVKSLNYESEPNYHKLRDLFRGLYKTKKYAHDSLYDWDKPVSK